MPDTGPDVPGIGVVQRSGRIQKEHVVCSPSSASQKPRIQESGS
jgi:hypothetical protein